MHNSNNKNPMIHMAYLWFLENLPLNVDCWKTENSIAVEVGDTTLQLDLNREVIPRALEYLGYLKTTTYDKLDNVEDIKAYNYAVKSGLIISKNNKQ
jgi:hypothetical protein